MPLILPTAAISAGKLSGKFNRLRGNSLNSGTGNFRDPNRELNLPNGDSDGGTGNLPDL
jgi:hypothetical protein